MVWNLFVVFFLGYMRLQQVQSSAVSPVYVQSGKDVLLTVSGVPVEFRLFVWRFKTQDSNLIFFSLSQKPEPIGKYKGRIQFFDNNNYDVILMNLQQTDSGVYIAQVTTDEGDQILIEHNIIVQDPVSPVELQLDSVTNSSHSCNITVTCSTPNSHISSTFTCVNNTCDQDGGEQSKVTNSTASLRVYVTNQMVICEHSNQVSRTMNKSEVPEVCKVKNEEAPNQLEGNGRKKIGMSVGFTLVIAVIAVLVGVCYRKKKAQRKETIENTIYEVPQVAKSQSPENQHAAAEDASDLSPISTYSLLGSHGAPMRPTDAADKPESLYSEIKK